MKRILIAGLIACSLMSCKQSHSDQISEDSVYNLSSKWQKQDGSKIQLVDLKGKVVVMVMIYTSCKTACPRLTAEMRQIAQKVGDADAKDIRYVLVSIDPEKDTPEKMTEYLKTNKFDSEQWVFLRADEDDTRELANVLSVKYKEISPIDFSHSNIISVFSKDGSLAFQKEGLGLDIEGTVAEIKKQLQ